MYSNLEGSGKGQGVEAQRKLYAATGDKVIDVYEALKKEKKSPEEIKAGDEGEDRRARPLDRLPPPRGHVEALCLRRRPEVRRREAAREAERGREKEVGKHIRSSSPTPTTPDSTSGSL